MMPSFEQHSVRRRHRGAWPHFRGLGQRHRLAALAAVVGGEGAKSGSEGTDRNKPLPEWYSVVGVRAQPRPILWLA
jgi:hypothetical protein